MSGATLPKGMRADLRVFMTGDEGHAAVMRIRNLPMVPALDHAPDPVAMLSASGADLGRLMSNPRLMTDAEIRGHLAEEDVESLTDHDAADATLTAAADVLAERRRQIEAEGWTSEHDDTEHDAGELAAAASTYALSASRELHPLGGDRISAEEIRDMTEDGGPWPFAPKWFKPTTPRRDLVKAAALLLAEIERLDRAALAKDPAR